MLAGSLLALGGCETLAGRTDKKEVSPSTNSWIYASNLPTARSKIAVALLSTTELLVTGGSVGSVKVNTIIKGTLTMSIL